MSRSSFVKAKMMFRDEGVLALIRELVRKVIKRFIYRKRVVVFLNRDLNLGVRPYKSSKRWQYRIFDSQDITCFKKHFERFMPNYSQMFIQGNKAFGGLEVETNDVIGVAWFADKDFYDEHYFHHTFEVSRQQVLQFACEVSEPYRNTQLVGFVLGRVYEYWKEKGKTELITVIDALNRPSMRLMFHLGWEEAGEVLTFHQLFGFRWVSTELYQGERYGHYKKKRIRKEAV